MNSKKKHIYSIIILLVLAIISSAYIYQMAISKTRREIYIINNAVEKGYWEKTIKDNTIQAFENYKRLYPYGLYIREADKQLVSLYNLETIVWEKAKLSNNAKSYESYLKEYPTTKNAKLAMERLSEIEFASINDLESESALSRLKLIVQKYPDTSMAIKANEQISKIYITIEQEQQRKYEEELVSKKADLNRFKYLRSIIDEFSSSSLYFQPMLVHAWLENPDYELFLTDTMFSRYRLEDLIKSISKMEVDDKGEIKYFADNYVQSLSHFRDAAMLCIMYKKSKYEN
jgi:hypothetical protein